jgi:hypothetical protein
MRSEKLALFTLESHERGGPMPWVEIDLVQFGIS